jgi:hypothetical protein
MFGMFGLRKTVEWNNDPNQQQLIKLLVAAAWDTGWSTNYSALTNFIIHVDWTPSETRTRIAHALSFIRFRVERDVYKRTKQIGRDFTEASYRLG